MKIQKIYKELKKINKIFLLVLFAFSSTFFYLAYAASISQLGFIQHGSGANVLQTPQGVFLSNSNVFVVSSGSDSLSAFNISDLSMITELGNIVDDNAGGMATQLDGATGLYISGSYAYVASSVDDSLSALNISDPTMITESGTIVDNNMAGTATQLDGATGVFVSGNYAYVASSVDDSLSIFDISDPTMITQSGTIVDNNMAGSATQLDGANSVFVVGSYAYVTAATENSLSVFDVSDPTMISEVSTITDGGSANELAGPNSVYVTGGKAYVASGTDDSLSIIGVSDPTMISELGTIVDNNRGGMATQLDGAKTVRVYDTYAYVTSATDNSLSIFDISNPASISEVEVAVNGGAISQFTAPNSLFVSNNFAYITTADNALCAFNVPITTYNYTLPVVEPPKITIPANGEIVRTNRPTISGTAIRGTMISIVSNGVLLGTALSSGVDGTWSCNNIPQLPDGNYSIYSYVNATAEVSGKGETVNFTIDTISPIPTPTPVPTATPSGQRIRVR